MKISRIGSISFNSVNFNNKNNVRGRNVITASKTDSVSFSSDENNRYPINVTPDKARFVANSLSTSTSGHRAPYGSENFNSDIVKLITLGVAGYADEIAKKYNHMPPYVLIGGDTRRATRESLPVIRDVLTNQGVEVISIEEPVPTPVLAVGAKKIGVDLAVLMTASHNPWKDGGYNLVTKAGAIAPASVTQQVAKYMTDYADKGYYSTHPYDRGSYIEFDLFDIYSEALDNLNLIDWYRIKESGLVSYYDGLHGAGTYFMPKLMNSKGVNFHEIVSSGQSGPNPIHDRAENNLAMLERAVASVNNGLRVGLANDGDADRFGVVDEKGNYINANDVILLLGYHLVQNKDRAGAIIRSQATSMQLDALADYYGLKKIETPVGFKYIAEDIIGLRNKGNDILVAGEESGGLTVNGHIPEKDGIVALALIMDLIATENKPISKILIDVKKQLGKAYAINNFSKIMSKEDMTVMMERIEDMYQGAMRGDVKFGDDYEIDSEKTAKTRANMEKYRPGGDGYKFILTDGSSVLMRKSGTEPKIKCYIEATGANQNLANANALKLQQCMNKFFNS